MNRCEVGVVETVAELSVAEDELGIVDQKDAEEESTKAGVD